MFCHYCFKLNYVLFSCWNQNSKVIYELLTSMKTNSETKEKLNGEGERQKKMKNLWYKYLDYLET